MLVVTLCVLAAGLPVPASFLYERGAREPEPYVYAAFPLHAPLPVLRVLSRAPLHPPPPPHQLRGADPPPPPPSARPYAPEQDYEATSYEYPRPTYYRKPHRQTAPLPAYEYAAAAGEHAAYALQLPALPRPQLTYAIAAAPAPYEAQEAAAAPAVLYARPSPSGGYTYRRVPDATATPHKKTSALKEKEKDPPFIVKIHKYRIVRDDLI